jgi:disulfide bond formation protein DsbB
MLNTLTPRLSAALIAVVLVVVIAGAFIFEWAGYAPCDLCLMQRWAYYAGIPLATALAALNPPWIKWGLILLLALMIGNAIFGVYHAGVEWKFWEGPSTCGSGTVTGGLPNLSKPAVLCNEAALRILGLSLAGWNAVISAGLAVIAFTALRKS